MYTFSETYQEVATLLQRDQDTTFTGKCKYWVNLGATVAYNAYDYWEELEAVLTPFNSVQGQETYYMPSDFDKPTRIYDFSNNRKLTINTRQEYVDANVATVSAQTQGTPQYAMIYGISAVNFIETSGFMVRAKSSNSMDTTTPTVRVEGWLDSAKTILGYTNIVISSSSPTSYVVDPNSVTFYGITRVTKSADTVGYITLADQSSRILANIPPVDRESRYPVLYLGLVPNAAYSYGGLYKRKIKKMVNDNDYPFTDIQDFLILYAMGWALSEEKETVERSQQIWSKATDLLNTQIRNSMNKLGDDYQHKIVPQTSQTHRF